MGTIVASLVRAAVGRSSLLWACLLVMSLTCPQVANAGGLYLMPRGAGPAARAGAVVAGAQGVHSLWYNPAGLARSGRELLFDLTLPLVRADFRRYVAQADGSFTRQARAHASSAPIPIPTLGYTDSLGLEKLGFGVALLVPPGYALDWPNRVDGEPAPQRYSVLDTRGTGMGTLALGVAYRALDWLSVGATLHLTAAQVGGTVAVSACDYAVCTIPEAREWEGRTRFLLGPVYTASGTLGGIADLGIVRLGLSGQLRTVISGEASFDVSLPDQAFFDGVSVENGKGGRDLRASMKVVLPGVLRAGVQVLPTRALALELGGTWERWSVQDSVRIDPQDVFVRNVPTLGTVKAQPVSLARNMKDTFAIQLGGQYDLSALFDRALFANAGAMFESSAFDDRDLSPTTLDTRKTMLALGVSVELVRHVLLDLSYGHLFMDNRQVRDSRVLLPSAIRPTPDERPAIADGNYAMEADFVGLSVRWTRPVD